MIQSAPFARGLRAISAALAALALPSVAIAQCGGANIRFSDLLGYETEFYAPFSHNGSQLSIVGIVNQFCYPFANIDPNAPGTEYTMYVTGLVSAGTQSTGTVGPVRYTTNYSQGTIAIYQGSPRNAPGPNAAPANPPNATVPSTFQDGTPFLLGHFTSFQIQTQTNPDGTYGTGVSGTITLDPGGYATQCQVNGWPPVQLFAAWSGQAGDVTAGYRFRAMYGQISGTLPVNPTVSVTPACGAQGTLYSQPGSGFTANSDVELHFIRPNGTESAPPYPVEHTNGCGTFSHSYASASASQFGTYSYYAIDLVSGRQSNTVPFKILEPMAAPSGLVVTKPGDPSSLHVEWQPSPSPGIQGYHVYRAVDGGFETLYRTQTETVIEETGLTRQASYTYRVAAYFDCVESARIGPVTGTPDYYPVLLVHGLCSDPATFTECGDNFPCDFGQLDPIRLGDVLHVADPQLRLYVAQYGQLLDLVSAAAVVAQRVNDVLTATGESKLTIVAHSQGGLIARYLAHTLGYGSKIDQIVMIGTPNHGTDIARMAGLPPSQQPRWFRKLMLASLPCILASDSRFDMQPGSTFLNQLNYDGLHFDTKDAVLCGNHPIAEEPDPPPAPTCWLLHGTSGWCKVPKGALNSIWLCSPNDGVVETQGGRDGDLVRLDVQHKTQDITLDPGHVHPLAAHFGFAAGSCFVSELAHPGIANAVLSIITQRSLPAQRPAIAERLAPPRASDTEPDPGAQQISHADGHLEPGETRPDTIVVEPTNSLTILQSADIGGLDLALRSPSGVLITVADTSAAVVFESESTLGFRAFTIADPEPGSWIVESALPVAGEAQDYSVDAFVVTDAMLAIEASQELADGHPGYVRAHLDVSGAATPSVVLTGTLTAPDSVSSALAFLDDGQHGDGASGDGIFGAAAIGIGAAGGYAVRVEADATVANLGAIHRTATTALTVQLLPDLAIDPGTIQVTSWTPGGGTDSLRVGFHVANAGSGAGDGAIIRLREVAGPTFGQQTANVGPGDDVMLSALWIPSRQDSETLFVFVDRSSPFLQSRYDNDTAMVVIAPGTVSVTPSAEVAPRIFARGFPNPARGEVTIEFTLPQAGIARLGIYDIAGRLVSGLAEGVYPPGVHATRWNRRGSDGRVVAPGVYFYELRFAGERVARRLVILR